jgi:hypothetical protein
MSANRLREAAARIRKAANATREDAPHLWYDPGDLTAELEPISDAPIADAAHIALWSPPVAQAVARLLDRMANDVRLRDNAQALALADVILDGAS